MTEEEFGRKFGRAERTVQRLKCRRMLSRVFKGKWLETIIATELNEAFRGRRISGPNITNVAKALFDFNASWCVDHMRRVSDFMEQVH